MGDEMEFLHHVFILDNSSPQLTIADAIPGRLSTIREKLIIAGWLSSSVTCAIARHELDSMTGEDCLNSVENRLGDWLWTNTRRVFFLVNHSSERLMGA